MDDNLLILLAYPVLLLLRGYVVQTLDKLCESSSRLAGWTLVCVSLALGAHAALATGTTASYR